jgi:hypothetical protein
MATNDFQPFAYGGSANVVSQSAYLALASTLQNGFSSGVATSAQLNKVWRQSSIMAAVLGQFIANTTGQNATDDGTTATLLANLIAAVSAQSEAPIGNVRNLSMSVPAASASATMLADEIIVGSALGGLKYTLSSFSKTINLATTGAGGMDAGTAPTSGYVALYAIYNPTTGASAILATNATSAVQPSVYGGANMPSGYTASALISIAPTNASGQFTPLTQIDRKVGVPNVSLLNTSATTAGSTFTAAGMPRNAKFIYGALGVTNTATSTTQLSILDSDSPTGGQSVGGVISAGTSQNGTFAKIAVLTPQLIRYGASATTGTPGFIITLSAYEF